MPDPKHWRDRLAERSARAVPGNGAERTILFALLALAALLRCWDLPHLPYHHDELSALTRLYPTLWETIREGVVRYDTHPPGTQVFEWLWTRVFGLDETAVKLPFILMSLAALFFLYRFAAAWLNCTVALVMLSVLSTLQYNVMFGQLARPYAMGLFTTALLADQLTRYLAHGRRRSLAWAFMAAVLSAYTHHFAMLLAGLMVTSVFVILPAAQRRPYLLASGLALLAYLPNIPILLHQLKQGGLGEWLAPPDRHWLVDYAWWVAHCSLAMVIVFLGLIAFSIVGRYRLSRPRSPFLWLALVWGALPLAIGFGYSIWRAPVLQYSVLLFSFPYLLLLFIGGMRHFPAPAIAVGCTLVASVSVFTLVSERKHFELFYQSKYEVMLREGMAARATYGDECAVYLQAPEHILSFYLDRWGINRDSFPFTNVDTLSLNSICSLLANERCVFFGGTVQARPEMQATFRKDGLVHRHDMSEGSTFLWCSDAPSTEEGLVMQATWSGSTGDDPRWRIGKDIHQLRMLDVNNGGTGAPYLDMRGSEFGISFTAPLDSLIGSPYDLIDLEVERLPGEADADLYAVVELQEGGTVIAYKATPLDECSHVALPLTRSMLRDRSPVLSVYLWNKGKGSKLIRRTDLVVRCGNPVQHGLFEPITAAWRYH